MRVESKLIKRFPFENAPFHIKREDLEAVLESRESSRLEFSCHDRRAEEEEGEFEVEDDDDNNRNFSKLKIQIYISRIFQRALLD